MKKTLIFEAVSENGIMISASSVDENVFINNIAYPQTYAVKLPKNEGKILLNEKGLEIIEGLDSIQYKFFEIKRLIRFEGFRYLNEEVNSVLYCEADSFEFLEKEVE